MWLLHKDLDVSAKLLAPIDAGVCLYRIFEGQPAYWYELYPSYMQAYGRQIILANPQMASSQKYYDFAFQPIKDYRPPWWHNDYRLILNHRGNRLARRWSHYDAAFEHQYKQPRTKIPHVTPEDKPNTYLIGRSPFRFKRAHADNLDVFPEIRPKESNWIQDLLDKRNGVS